MNFASNKCMLSTRLLGIKCIPDWNSHLPESWNATFLPSMSKQREPHTVTGTEHEKETLGTGKHGENVVQMLELQCHVRE